MCNIKLPSSTTCDPTFLYFY